MVSLVGSGTTNSDFVNDNGKKKLMEGDTATGGLVVKMGPVMNVHVDVEDVKVISGHAVASLPAITEKGSLFEGFSHNRLYAISYSN
ncbi:MAG TPA: hypothetical protein VHJ20_20920 [Polyangia bacterium]|nr:hypothetical protein [Polyangia bacterium]